jgi:hypothetical protein
MKKIEVFKKENPDEVIGKFNDREDASSFIIDQCEEDDDVTVFDFDIREVDEAEPADLCPDFAASCKFLGISDEFAFDCADDHIKAMQSLYMLVIIAQAWNKIDGFTPDWSDGSQWKYFPWFVYRENGGDATTGASAGFVFALTHYAATSAAASIGSRLCFKSSNRARQFGEMFTDLFNDFLLFNK